MAAAKRCFPLLLTLAAAVRSDLEQGERTAALASASGVLQPGLSPRLRKCDPQAVDTKKYGRLVNLSPKEKASARFWDACPATGKSCPSHCEPFASAISLSGTQRAFRWIGRRFSGACKKTCRYRDEHMLQPENVKSFFATSLAVLQAKLSKQSGCSTIASLILPGCGARQQKILSLARFVFSAFRRLRESADCEQQLPQNLRTQLADVIKDFYLPLEEQAPAGVQKADKTSGMLEMLRHIRSGKFCQAVQKTDERKRTARTTDTDERIDLMVDAAMKSAAKSGLKVPGNNSREEVVRKLKQERSASTEDQLFDKELKDDEARVSKLLSQSEEDRSSNSLIQLGFDKAVVDTQGVGGVLKGILWHFLYHGVFGTIFGALSTVVCWITFAEASNAAGTTNIDTWWKGILWIPLCAFQSFAYGYGITDGGSLFEDWDLS
eukprot:TRINITY_DN91999_c0_g1_i1.p1 TRINITY_DN91999_c0_g1~~TRINITY_DN91999_c0_g1_i1.p1  ORF type:complete len:444 (-),score=80.19 TRINITY_DN91999_c0_g1_i1:33-1343(-)